MDASRQRGLRLLRKRMWGMLAAAVAVGLLTATVSTAGVSQAVTGSPSGFESSDGNMVLDNLTGSSTDWNCFLGTSNFQPGTPSAACAITKGATEITADQSGEVEWVNGQKFDTQCPALATGNNPPKDEFTNIASFNDTASNLDTFFYGATIRSTANGNASGDVEFNQNSGNGTTSAGCRTAGDRLVAYDYLNGGTSLNFHVLTWIDINHPNLGGNSGTCFVKTDVMPCWGGFVVTVSPSLFDGQSNQSAITAANNGISGAALAINQFAEFGVNLTQALGLGGKCFAFPQEVWESRSSGSSFTSNPQDIEVEHHTIANCGEIKVIKQTDPRGQDQVFSFTSNLPANSSAGGVPCTAGGGSGIQGDGSFCLNDTGNSGKTLGSADAAQNSAGNTVDTGATVLEGTYTVAEGTEPGSYSFESLNCTADAVSGSSASVPQGSETATITLKAGGLVTCVYENQLHQGAIVITKTGKDKNCTGAGSPVISNGVCTGTSTADLSGAQFTIAGPGGPVGSGPVTTGADGTVCVDKLPWSGSGTTYTVTETVAPKGYALDTTSTAVIVTQNATCGSSANAATISFTDTPLTDLSVTASAEVPGATNSTVTCVQNTTTGTTGIGTNGPSDPASVSATGLAPGTYTCTVVIDP